MSLSRAAVSIIWFASLFAVPGWVGWHHGWRLGLALFVWGLFAVLYQWDVALWDIRSDGYLLDKVPAEHGRKRWRVRLAQDPQGRAAPATSRNPNKH
jgi:hypothetical protein